MNADKRESVEYGTTAGYQDFAEHTFNIALTAGGNFIALEYPAGSTGRLSIDRLSFNEIPPTGVTHPTLWMAE